MKYTDTQIGFQEFPDEISLLINISNCPFHCPGCHSPELWEDVGTELTIAELDKLIKSNKGITCVGFMGGTWKELIPLVENIRVNYPNLKIGWYTGNKIIPQGYKYQFKFDYIKTGPYIEWRGPLDNPHTNQKMWKITRLNNNGTYTKEDITYKFWKHGNNK